MDPTMPTCLQQADCYGRGGANPRPYQLRVHDNSMRAEDEMRMEGENEVDEGKIESTQSGMTQEWHW
jgi:hypothetical protein